MAPVTGTVTPDKRKQYIVIGAVAAVLLAIIGFVVFSGGDDSGNASTRTEDTTDETTDDTTGDSTDPTDPPGTDAPVSNPTAAPADTTTRAADAPTPLSDTELVPALIDPSDLNAASGWSITASDTSTANFCGQVNRTQPVSTITQTLTRTQPDGNSQLLINTLESYTDTATANATFQETRSIVRSCDSFTTSEGLDAQIEAFDETPTAGCQGALVLRLSFFNPADNSLVGTNVASIVLCGNNASSMTFSTLGLVTAADEANEWRVAGAVTTARLLTLRQVP